MEHSSGVLCALCYAVSVPVLPINSLPGSVFIPSVWFGWNWPINLGVTGAAGVVTESDGAVVSCLSPRKSKRSPARLLLPWLLCGFFTALFMNLTSGLGAELLLLLPDWCVFQRMTRRRKDGEKLKVSVVGRIEKLPVFWGEPWFFLQKSYCRKLITYWSCCCWKESLTNGLLPARPSLLMDSPLESQWLTCRGSALSSPHHLHSNHGKAASIPPGLIRGHSSSVTIANIRTAPPLKNLECPWAAFIKQNPSRQGNEETSHKGS